MKRLFLVCCIFILSVFQVGCAKNKQPEIQFSTWGSKTEMSIITPIVEEYNKTHEVKVKIVHIPQNYFHKLHLLFASNLDPDVIFINNLYLRIYQKADLLEDLTPIINKSDYFKNAISTLSIDEKIYAVPRDVSSFVIFYNKDVLDKANIKVNENWSVDEFYNNAQKAQKYSQYGFCTEFEPSSWENFVSTANKPPIYDNKITINEEKSLKALQNLSDNINKKNIGVNKEQLALSPCAQLFLNQKSAMFVSGRWSVPKLNEQASFNYGIAPFPYGGSKYYIPLNASGWAVSKKSKYKDEAINFVKYLSSDENIQKMTNSGLITPAKVKIANSDSMSKVFVSIIDKSTPNIVPSDYNVLIDKINLSVKTVLEGYKPASVAFDK